MRNKQPFFNANQMLMVLQSAFCVRKWKEIKKNTACIEENETTSVQKLQVWYLSMANGFRRLQFQSERRNTVQSDALKDHKQH